MGIPYNVRGIEIQCACLNPAHIDAHPSFSINSKTALFYCFSCQYKGTFKKYLDGEIDEDMERTAMYLQSLEALEDIDADVDGPISPVMLPPDSGIPIPPEGIRGISKEVLDRLEVFYCSRGKYKGRLIFPVKDTEGTLLGFDARIYTPKGHTKIEPINPQAKYLRPSSFKTAGIVYGTYKSAYSDTIILTEGVFDALSWIELGYPAACNFGLLQASPEKAGMLLATGATKIACGFDLDKAGFEGWQNIKEGWRSYMEISRPSAKMKEFQQSGYKDINDYLIHLKEGE